MFLQWEISPQWFKILELLFINVLLGLNEMFADKLCSHWSQLVDFLEFLHCHRFLS